ncbi:MAG TPA: ABC transporter permease [Magnetospirillaceae bacterium]|nr:ABC transporter permease [Magnetospirillaceae bacterium]
MPDKEPPQLSWDKMPSGNVVIRIAGHWLIEHGLIGDETIAGMLADVAPGGSVVLDAEGLLGWDSSLIEFLTRSVRMCEARGVIIDRSGTPEDVKRLIGLAFAVPDHPDRHKMPMAPPPLARIGGRFLVNVALGIRMLGFFGESVLAFGRLLRGASAMRGVDFCEAFTDCGPRALPIVCLISVLVGLIMAFIGAVQLTKFGAQVYVANLVGIAMVREMGALMAAIIMAGRTGASYAANLGTMQLNDEVSALRTVGIDPMDFLVLPRLLALALALPLLTIFANLAGMLGGAALAAIHLNIDWPLYITQTRHAVTVTDLILGLVKACLFGSIVAVTGCWCGMAAERHAAGVGQAATNAVVLTIVLVIFADAVITVMTSVLGI